MFKIPFQWLKTIIAGNYIPTITQKGLYFIASDSTDAFTFGWDMMTPTEFDILLTYTQNYYRSTID